MSLSIYAEFWELKPMIDPLNDYAFCTLALGEKYVLLAQKIAANLAEKAPGKMLITLTDNFGAFASIEIW
jgi:hypothetical protein